MRPKRIISDEERLKFAIRNAKAREKRQERIANLRDELLKYLDKYKIDDRDAKFALRDAYKIVRDRQ